MKEKLGEIESNLPPVLPHVSSAPQLQKTLKRCDSTISRVSKGLLNTLGRSATTPKTFFNPKRNSLPPDLSVEEYSSVGEEVSDLKKIDDLNSMFEELGDVNDIERQNKVSAQIDIDQVAKRLNSSGTFSDLEDINFVDEFKKQKSDDSMENLKRLESEDSLELFKRKESDFEINGKFEKKCEVRKETVRKVPSNINFAPKEKKKSKNGISFRIKNIKTCNSFLKSEEPALLEQILQKQFQRKERKNWVVYEHRYEVEKNFKGQTVYTKGKNSFLEAVLTAYENSCGLVLSPDMFFYLILKNIQHSIELKKGKKNNIKKVCVENSSKSQDLPYWDHHLYPEFDFVKFYEKNSSKVTQIYLKWMRDLTKFTASKETFEIIPKKKQKTFSCTSQESLLSLNSSLINTVKYPQDFLMVEETRIGSGIPFIRLKGTKSDWKHLYKKSKSLLKTQTELWSKIEPLLSRFVQSFEPENGSELSKFWKSMVNIEDTKGMTEVVINGWIKEFFPYCVKKGKLGLRTSEELKVKEVPSGLSWCDTLFTARMEKITSINLEKSNYSQVYRKNLNTEFIKKRQVVETQEDLRLVSGLTQVVQHQRDYSLEPKFGILLLKNMSCS
eukprot:snap_masked-scaffold_67-processed-gene-0.42-mRNA-1 protein AED:1.00 eAED:1.00 QI:0/-1/0/0/-1/1/1/0/612